jgi:hypothetical protein
MSVALKTIGEQAKLLNQEIDMMSTSKVKDSAGISGAR